MAQRFVDDLGASAREVAATPAPEGGMAPIYGMAAQLPGRATVEDMERAFIDLWYAP